MLINCVMEIVGNINDVYRETNRGTYMHQANTNEQQHGIIEYKVARRFYWWRLVEERMRATTVCREKERKKKLYT